MDIHFTTLDAWIDGEPVARAAVLDALADPDGREYIVDAMALRHAVHATAPTLEQAVGGTRRSVGWRPLAAAAMVVLSVAAGFMAGRGVSSRPGEIAGPPAPMPVTTPATDRPRPVVAPAPTRVIRFEAGVDWREAGGN